MPHCVGSLIGVLFLACAATAPHALPPPQQPAPNAPDATGAEAAGAASTPGGDLHLRARPRLDFERGGPILPIGLMEGQTEVVFSSPRRIRIRVAGAVDKTVEGAPGSRWRARIRGGEPAIVSPRIVLGELSYLDKSGVATDRQAWEARGLPVRVRTTGTVYGIRGHVIDNRRYLLLLDQDVRGEEVSERRRSLERQFGIRTSIIEDVERESSGWLELLDGDGSLVAISKDRLSAEPVEGGPITVSRVEYGIGYDFHGFEDRSYRGSLELTVDRRGKLAVVNNVLLEELLKGLVPSEMFARAPIEALKAQAVTARGEVLAKVGTRHLGDPYLLCSEQHCAVYKGLSGEAESSSAAVDATRGEALFSSDRRLVDSVYSAVCGGHTEDNDVVWGGPANPNLRGKPDLLGVEAGTSSPRDLAAFLSTEVAAACRLASLAQPGKYRWERRFSREEVDRLTMPLGVGTVRAVAVVDRGASGRARTIEIAGSARTVRILGELNIRKLFGMLNSSMFVVQIERSPEGEIQAFHFRGGGWGHGVGMCQLGAIGRAEQGQDHRAILRHYFSGAEVFRLY